MSVSSDIWSSVLILWDLPFFFYWRTRRNLADPILIGVHCPFRQMPGVIELLWQCSPKIHCILFLGQPKVWTFGHRWSYLCHIPAKTGPPRNCHCQGRTFSFPKTYLNFQTGMKTCNYDKEYVHTFLLLLVPIFHCLLRMLAHCNVSLQLIFWVRQTDFYMSWQQLTEDDFFNRRESWFQ